MAVNKDSIGNFISCVADKLTNSGEGDKVSKFTDSIQKSFASKKDLGISDVKDAASSAGISIALIAVVLDCAYKHFIK